MKDMRQALEGEFTDDELKRIHILEEGQRLRQGARYLDVNAPDRAAFTATGDQRVGSGERIVPKADTPYWLWNRLRGVESTERTLEQEGGREA